MITLYRVVISSRKVIRRVIHTSHNEELMITAAALRSLIISTKEAIIIMQPASCDRGGMTLHRWRTAAPGTHVYS